MKLNKNGFTLIELITTFTLASIIMVFLFSIVMVLKDTYISKHTKTELIIKQSLLSQKINDDFTSNNIVSLKTCGNKCYDIELSTGQVKRLEISTAGDMIKYDDFTYKLNNSSYVGPLNVEIKYIDITDNKVNNSILILSIPIYNKKFPNENFGIKVVYQFNSEIYNVSI